MFIKWGKISRKFKKDPPHIGEYDKKVHFGGGRSIVHLNDKPFRTYKNIIKNSILKYLNRKKQYKYYNKAIVTKYYRIKRS